MVVLAFNPGTQEGERQTDLGDFEASEFHNSQGYLERHGLKRDVWGMGGQGRGRNVGNKASYYRCFLNIYLHNRKSYSSVTL